MSIGDKVKTFQGEVGVIVEKCPDYMVYDWWVEIKFVARGKRSGEVFTTKIPFREGELSG